MSKETPLGKVLTGIFTGVGVASEAAVVFSEVMEKTANAVQDGIEHLINVFPEYFGEEEESEEEEPEDKHVWGAWGTPGKVYGNDRPLPADASADAPVDREPTREDKIEQIQKYLIKHGHENTIWHTNPISIADNLVNVTYDTMVRIEDEEAKRAAKKAGTDR